MVHRTAFVVHDFQIGVLERCVARLAKRLHPARHEEPLSREGTVARRPPGSGEGMHLW